MRDELAGVGWYWCHWRDHSGPGKPDGATCTAGRNHIHGVLWGDDQPHDAHIEDVVIQKAMRAVLGIELVECFSGRSNPCRVHSMTSLATEDILSLLRAHRP